MSVRALLLSACITTAATLATPLRAQNAAGQKWHMTTYYLVLLRSGPRSGQGDSATRAKMFDGHMANIRRLAIEGPMVVAGPIEKGGDLRGIFVLKAASMEEATRLVGTDPGVQAGEFRPEIYTWWTASGLRTDATGEIK